MCKENLKGENESCGSRLDRKHGVSLEEVLEVKEGLGFKIEGYRKGSDIGKGKCDSKPRGIVPKFSFCRFGFIIQKLFCFKVPTSSFVHLVPFFRYSSVSKHHVDL